MPWTEQGREAISRQLPQFRAHTAARAGVGPFFHSAGAENEAPAGLFRMYFALIIQMSRREHAARCQDYHKLERAVYSAR